MLRKKPDAPAAMFKTPAGIGIAVFTLILIAWLLSNATWQDARDSAIAAAIGLLIYLGYKFTQRGVDTEKTES